MPSPEERWNDLLQAWDFSAMCFAKWTQKGEITPDQLEKIQALYEDFRKNRPLGNDEELAAADGLPAGWPGEAQESRLARYWTFVGHEIRRFVQNGLLTLAQSHALQAEARERHYVLKRRVVPEPSLPASAKGTSSAAKISQPRRSLLEIVLDPRNIQMLLAIGGALMVVGLVILLWVNEFFTPPVVAVGLGIVNGVLLVAGWWVLRSTRYQLAGRAVTLLACLVMPLNLWYYHVNHLITLDNNLWLAALVISSLYAASAYLLRDELFVYIFMAGVTLTGMLFLADLPTTNQVYMKIAMPAMLLVVLGLLAIHVERAFLDQEGPFGRKRFGLAFFWSGHALLAVGLLLVLRAQITGDWLYEPIFKTWYGNWGFAESPFLNEQHWLMWALALVVVGTYGYIYSDLVVRHVGVYVHIAAGTLMWAILLSLEFFHIRLGLDALIAVLALTAMVVNGRRPRCFAIAVTHARCPFWVCCFLFWPWRWA